MSDGFIEAAIANSLARGELGLQVGVYHRGELVLDAWGGAVDRAGTPVVRDTIFPAASTGKSATATALHLQAERGYFDYDDPIGSVWPEFACNGKEHATIRHALTHTVGLPYAPEGTTREKERDWNWVVESLAAMEPVYPPGAKNAYHSHTWGWIIGEIVRRTDPKNRPFPQFLREEVCAPLAIRDLWCQMPPSEFSRLAKISGTYGTPTNPNVVIDEDDERNQPGFWDIENPSSSVMAARDGARLFGLYAHGGTLDGVRLLSEDRVRSFLTPRPHASDPDIIAGRIRLVGMGGFWLGGSSEGAEKIVGFGEHVLWFPGAGGTVGFADLDADLAVVICHNNQYAWEGLPREAHPFTPIVEAIYQEFAP